MKRVFLVQDMENILTLLPELFSCVDDLEVVGAATSPAEAELWVESNNGAWDIAIIDVVLDPGLEVIAACKRISPNRKVAVFGEYASPEAKARCIRSGADAVFNSTQASEFISWLSMHAHGD